MKTNWYDKKWVVIVLIIIFFPIYYGDAMRKQYEDNIIAFSKTPLGKRIVDETHALDKLKEARKESAFTRGWKHVFQMDTETGNDVGKGLATIKQYEAGSGSKVKNDYSENDFVIKIPKALIKWEYHINEAVVFDTI